MKITKMMGTASLLLLFGIAAPAHAQEPREQQDPPKEQPKEQSKEQPKKEEPPKNPKDQPDKPKEQPRPENREAAPPRDEHAKPEQAQRARIPDDKFRAHFGREHTFHISHPQIVGGQPHFQYSGYSFVIAQARPAGWGYNDDVYIVDVDGAYYLVDLAHPGVQLALTVVL